ncbi:MAG: MSMEG_0570 family nitrogen starvation response protein [Pseudomonadota bacterium]
MPERRMTLRWPDGSEGTVYSPSTVIAEHFAPGEAMALAAFHARARIALAAASERVRARYGMSCARAAAEIRAIDVEVARQRPGTVTILAIA